MISARTPRYPQKNKTSDANPPKTKRTEKNTVQATETASSTKKNKQLNADALRKGKAQQFNKKPKAHQTESPPTEKIPAPTNQEEDLAPPEKTEKTIKKERIKSSPDAIGEATKNQKKSLDALKAWAKDYKKTENCSSATQKTINDIVQTVEEALNGRQLTVDLAKHASAFSKLKGARRKALHSALKPFNVTGLNEAKEKKASPQPHRTTNKPNTGLEKTAPTEAQANITALPETEENEASPQPPLTTDDPKTDDPNAGLEKTAPTDAQITLQLTWDEVVDEFEKILVKYFNQALKADDASNLQDGLDAFTKAFSELKEKSEEQAPNLDEISNGIETIMVQMLSHIHTQVDRSTQEDNKNLSGMKSLLIKLQGNESMQSMRDIWKTFASAWNKDLPEDATTIETDLLHFKSLEDKVAAHLPVDHPPVNLPPVNHLPVEKVSKAALPYNQENAWAAYNQEYSRFRFPTTHENLMIFADNDLTQYVNSFGIITAKDSGLSEEKAQQMVLQRSLVDFVSPPVRIKTDPKTNRAILGCERSYFDDHPEESPQQVAFIMDTPMCLEDNTIKKVTVLTVVAPALDSKQNPVWGDFVDGNDELKKDVYRKHYRSLCTLIKEASDRYPHKRVVISPVGTGTFLCALSYDQQEVARDIAANQLAELAIDLRDLGRNVAYTDLQMETGNSTKIMQSLLDKSQEVLTYAGALTGSWMNENDLYINAGDPHSCAGNGGSKDNSLEGKLGRYSLMSDIHVQVAINAQLAKTTEQ